MHTDINTDINNIIMHTDINTDINNIIMHTDINVDEGPGKRNFPLSIRDKYLTFVWGTSY